MSHSLTLTTIGILSVAGAAIGFQLGNAAVSEINPMYFQEPPTRFHSDLSPYRVQASSHYVAPVDMGSPLELGTGCVGCRTYPEEYFPQRDPTIDRALEGGPDDPPFEEAPAMTLAVAEAAPEAAATKRQADLDRLQRYASFPVSAEEAQRSLAEASDEATAIQSEEVAAMH